jgi:toxin ParE1/3/4
MADREATFEFISADSPRAAIANDERIRSAVNRLVDFPHSARPGRVEGTRELVVSKTSYVAIYRITDDLVFVLRVLHAAREWPEAP